jgi:ABC-type multidrug transport system ATPase subunit
MSSVLEILNLSKDFGRISAVKNLSLQVPKGAVFGILGPNGSGKTTTLAMILGASNPTSGSFYWFGENENHQVRKRIGAILEFPVFYPSFSAEKNLRITARIKEVSNDRIDVVLEMVGLLERKHDAFKTYSLGMKQRLAIASAMLCDPDVLILDEPTNGLDPQGIAEIRTIIRDIAEQGKTIILASHLLDEVQKVCTDFCILKSGNLIYQGKVSDSEQSTSTEIEVGAADKDLEVHLRKIPFVQSVIRVGDYCRVVVLSGHDAAALNAYLNTMGIHVSYLVTRKESLEEKFLSILNVQS